MSVNAHRSARPGLPLLLAATALLASACSSLNNATNSLAGMVTPYRVEVVQGNFVSREQVEALQPGMSREQVREILGTPLVTSLFHANRWEYVFTIKRPNEAPQTRKLTVFSKTTCCSATRATRCLRRPNSSHRWTNAPRQARCRRSKPRRSSSRAFRRRRMQLPPSPPAPRLQSRARPRPVTRRSNPRCAEALSPAACGVQ